MKLRGGLAWLAMYIIATDTVMEARDRIAELPHLHLDERSALELNTDLLPSAFSVTGSFNGPSIPFITSPSTTFSPFISAENVDFDRGDGTTAFLR